MVDDLAADIYGVLQCTKSKQSGNECQAREEDAAEGMTGTPVHCVNQC